MKKYFPILLLFVEFASSQIRNINHSVLYFIKESGNETTIQNSRHIVVAYVHNKEIEDSHHSTLGFITRYTNKVVIEDWSHEVIGIMDEGTVEDKVLNKVVGHINNGRIKNSSYTTTGYLEVEDWFGVIPYFLLNDKSFFK